MCISGSEIKFPSELDLGSRRRKNLVTTLNSSMTKERTKLEIVYDEEDRHRDLEERARAPQSDRVSTHTMILAEDENE